MHWLITVIDISVFHYFRIRSLTPLDSDVGLSVTLMMQSSKLRHLTGHIFFSIGGCTSSFVSLSITQNRLVNSHLLILTVSNTKGGCPQSRLQSWLHASGSQYVTSCSPLIVNISRGWRLTRWTADPNCYAARRCCWLNSCICEYVYKLSSDQCTSHISDAVWIFNFSVEAMGLLPNDNFISDCYTSPKAGSHLL